MAKKSSIQKDLHKRKLVENKKATRAALKKKIYDKNLDLSERIALVHKLAEVTRSSSATRVRNRCKITGRPRAFYRKFEMSRISLREMGSAGLIPGLTKASW